jgi:hypothetical protein
VAEFPILRFGPARSHLFYRRASGVVPGNDLFNRSFISAITTQLDNRQPNGSIGVPTPQRAAVCLVSLSVDVSLRNVDIRTAASPVHRLNTRLFHAYRLGSFHLAPTENFSESLLMFSDIVPRCSHLWAQHAAASMDLVSP